MKFKITFTVLLLMAVSLSLAARTISLQEAEKVAGNFLFITHNKYVQDTPFSQIRLEDPFIYLVDGNPVFYAFQTSPGFIIISADDAYTPVLGYSFTGTFDFLNAPDHYKGFILNYADQVLYARENNIPATPEFEALWQELREENIESMNISRERDVTPLISSTWDQGQPYNVLCPEDVNGPGGHTWVGCVATAMAQIMYYWRYPETGTGQHCYTPGNPSYGQQCANFGETDYRWEGMINSIDNKNPFPNAELQYHCAVSVNMSFSPDGSGSYSYLVPGRLNSFWRYNAAQYLEKQNYASATWINFLKTDIDQNYPVYYSGYNPSAGGHAFVCDGYQGDNFHFNFGWSGSGNGYYTLADVGGFSQSQAIVRNFVPSDASYPYHNSGNVIITEKSGSFTDGSGPAANYLNNNAASWLIDPQTEFDSINNITIKFPQFDVSPGDTVKVYDGGTTDAALLGAYSGTTLPPSQLTASSNKMLVLFTTDGSSNATGWYAEFYTTSPVWCSGLIQFTEPSGTFDDGSGSFYYQSGATCMWRINPLYAAKITLNFNYFETEEGMDKVKVFDGSTQIAEFSGSTVPGPVEATSGSMFITWSTNQSVNLQGWEAYYEVDNVGIHENAGISLLELYPNPASDRLNISFQVQERSSLNIRIHNLTGQELYFETQSGYSGLYYNSINVEELPSGIYFLTVSSENGSWNKKFVIR